MADDYRRQRPDYPSRQRPAQNRGPSYDPYDPYSSGSYGRSSYDRYPSPEEERRRRIERARRRRILEKKRRIRRIRRMIIVLLGAAVVVFFLVTGGRGKSAARTMAEASGTGAETAETAEAAGTPQETNAEQQAEAPADPGAPDESQVERAMTEAEEAAYVEEARAKRGFSEEVASFYPFYTFKETNDTIVVPGDPPEEEKAEEVQEEAPAQEEPVGNDYCASARFALVNCDTGEVTAIKEGWERIPPASMTKVLTLLVAVEHLRDTDSALKDTFTITQEICDFAYTHDSSSVCWLPGDEVTVEDMLYGAILQSGADAAMGLAQYTAGTEAAFVDMMNAKLSELGISDTAHFTNCVGLYDEEHYCTCVDMAVIMKAALENDLCRKILGTRTYTTTPTPANAQGIEISNWFLRRIEDKDSHGDVRGGKTGYVGESGHCAVSYLVSESGAHYILCTFNAWSPWRCIYDHVYLYSTYTR